MSDLAGRLVIKRGDLFDTKCPIIAHGCNTAGAFGSGVAGQIATRWPNVRDVYLEKHQNDGWRLGDVQFVEVGGDDIQIVANMATQERYGRKAGIRYVDYQALAEAVEVVLIVAENMGMSVAMPRVGCGLAGGDWGIVSGILAECVKDRSIHLEVWVPDGTDRVS